MLSKICAALLWVLLLLQLGVVFIYRQSAPAIVKTMAGRVSELLRPVDWMWILGGGVLLPCLAVLGMVAFSPLGGRESSLKMTVRAEGAFLPAVDFVILGLLLILLPLLIARWRLRLVAGMFGFRGRDFTGWTAVIALVGLMGGYLYFPGISSIAAVAVIPCVCLAVAVFRRLFMRSERLLRQMVMPHVLMVSTAASILCLIAATFAFGFAWQYWFEKDKFMKLTSEAPSIVPYEYRMARQYRAETLQVIEDR